MNAHKQLCQEIGYRTMTASSRFFRNRFSTACRIQRFARLVKDSNQLSTNGRCLYQQQRLKYAVSFSTSSTTDTIQNILKQVQEKKIDIQQAQSLLESIDRKIDPSNNNKHEDPKRQSHYELLQSFATLDYDRSERTGFPEAIFAQSKTVPQIASILDDMARSVNERIALLDAKSSSSTPTSNAILATR